MTIPADYAQINCLYGGAAYPSGAEFTMGVSIASYGGSPSALAASVVTAWTASLRDVTNTMASLVGVLVKFGPDATGPSATVGASVAGNVSDPPAPPSVAWLFRRNTAFGGRKGRGRLYLPGAWDGGVGEGGAVPSGTLSALQTKMDIFTAALVDLDCIPVLLHGDATVPYPITSIVPQSPVATQRRRQRR